AASASPTSPSATPCSRRQRAWRSARGCATRKAIPPPRPRRRFFLVLLVPFVVNLPFLILELAQEFEVERQLVAEPERVMSVIGVIVAGQRMDQHVVAAAVEHQPGHETGEIADGEGDLVHADRVRPDRPVMPIAEPRLRELC